MRTLTATLVLLFASATAFAGPRSGGMHHKPPPMRILQHADELGLTVEQQDQIKAVLDDGRSDHEAAREELRTLRGELRDLLEGTQVPDAGEVSALVQALGDVEMELREQRLLTMIDVRALLTPDQWTTLKSLRPERGEGDRRRGRHRPGDGPDGDVEGL